MATKVYEKVFLVLILTLTLYREATAQSSCSTMLTSISSCISYITGNSTKPLPACCSSLASVVQAQPECLCPLLSNGAGASIGVAFNRTLALALPVTCNMQTPLDGQCNDVANGPASVPASSPLSPTTDVSSEPPESQGETIPTSIPSGSKTDPETNVSRSDRTSVTTSSIYIRVITLLIAAWIINKFQCF